MSSSYNRAVLSDGNAKAALRKWPLRPREEWGWAVGTGCGPWVRVLPVHGNTKKNRRVEFLVVGMDTAATQPDGLWISVGPKAEFVDVVAVEHCGTRQNFYDKRSRYMATLYSRVLAVGKGWYQVQVPVQGGGSKTMRSLCQQFPRRMTGAERIPIRHVRVLYALHPKDYDTFHSTPFGPHEFFCPHYALTQRTSPMLRDFVKRLSTDVHWYTK
jgi:hypothetical protein